MNKRWKSTSDPSDGWIIAHFGESGFDDKKYFLVTEGMQASDLCDSNTDARNDSALAAAAPDLYEALKKIVDNGALDTSTFEQAKRALMKAEAVHESI